MSKPITLSFSVKSASELAATLGVSKKRQDRIFTIVGETAGKGHRSREMFAAKARTVFAAKNGSKGNRNVRVSSRPRKRSNAKAAH